MRSLPTSQFADKTDVHISLCAQDIPKLQHVHAEAVDIDHSSVKLSTGRELPYDYLVLCLGFEYRDARVYCPSGTVHTRRATFEVSHLVIYSVSCAGREASDIFWVSSLYAVVPAERT